MTLSRPSPAETPPRELPLDPSKLGGLSSKVSLGTPLPNKGLGKLVIEK